MHARDLKCARDQRKHLIDRLTPTRLHSDARLARHVRFEFCTHRRKRCRRTAIRNRSGLAHGETSDPLHIAYDNRESCIKHDVFHIECGFERITESNCQRAITICNRLQKCGSDIRRESLFGLHGSDLLGDSCMKISAHNVRRFRVMHSCYAAHFTPVNSGRIGHPTSRLGTSRQHAIRPS